MASTHVPRRITRRWRFLGPFIAIALLFGTLQTSAATTSVSLIGKHRTLASGRTYWLSGSGSVLVIGLPGLDLSAANLNATFWDTGNTATTGWQRHAIAHGYTLALGEERAGNWNVGGGWPGGSQDDLGYLLQVVSDAQAQRAAPSAGQPFSAVYIAGFSAGGAMAWTAAAQRPDIFKACGSASGWASTYPTHTMDCWHVHGTADTTVPIRGGKGAENFTFPPAYYEQSRTTRDSKVVLEATAGGHAPAGWMADRLWTFWTTGR